MKILIFGAGGIGSILGGFLARMGHEVSLLGRSWHLDVIEKNGLTITGIWGDYKVKAFDLFRSTGEIPKNGRDFDLIFLTVKSFDTEKAVDELLPLMGESTTLVSFQNGLGNIETILKRVRPEQFLIGRAIFGVETEPGIARVTVAADTLAVGSMPGVKPKMSAESLAHLLTLSKLQAKAVPNIIATIWSKVIYNCALNGLCTILEAPYGKVLEEETTRDQLKRIVHECYAVGQKKGISLEPPTADGYVDLLFNTLIPKTASHYPSMLQDLKKGKRADIDALNGAICSLGKTFGIATPENQLILDLVLKKFVTP